MQSETILLTGAGGFLGRAMRQELQSSHRIITLGQSHTNNYPVDLSKAIPELHQPIDWVLHAAGKAHSIPKTEAEAQKFFEVNLQGTIHLTKGLERLRQLPAAFIYISTVAVYGMDAGVDIDETYPLGGGTPYARSKIQAEAHLQEWCKTMGVTLTILRLPLLVGTSAPGNLGAMIGLIRRGLYVGIGSGAARKSMVLATDVASFIPVVATRSGIYNLTDGVHPSMLEFEIALTNRLGKRKPIRLPVWPLKGVAWMGDRLGDWFPLNSLRLNKLTGSLTFNDAKARLVGWRPHSVMDNLPSEL